MSVGATLDLPAAAGRRWDVAVIGAGPAGALAARELARSGVAVLLVDQARFPRWKICGACLNGRGLATLQAVGLGGLATELRAAPLTSMQLGAAGRSARLALPAGVALSRAALDAALVEAAVAAGAAFLPETAGSLEAVTSEGRTVALRQGPDEAAITARVVLAANGLKGALRGQPAEMQAHVEAGSRIGAGVLVEQGPAEYVAGTVYMAVGAKGYVGLVRVEDGRLNIAAAFDAGFVRRAGGPGPAAIQVLHEARFPAIAELAALPWKGTPPLTRQAPSPAAVRLFLLGDAAGYVEPFTGEGISWALATGQAVVPLALRALDGWQAELAADWSARLREIVGRRQRACRILAALLRRPLLSRLAVRLLEVAPQLANPLVRRLQR